MKRYIVSGLCCLTNALLICISSNINFALIKMVRKNNSIEEKYNRTNTGLRYGEYEIPTYNWDEITQQLVLGGAFYYGYAVTPIPAGWLANKTGGKLMILFAIVWSSVVTVLIPWAAGVGSGFVVTLKVLDGLGQGTVAPAIFALLSKWTVPDEISTMVSIAFAGLGFGLIIVSYLSSWICSMDELGGWPMSFYIYSLCGVILAIVWTLVVTETPQEDSCITETEVQYYSAISKKDKVSLVPWVAILSSSAVWANVISSAAFDFGYYTLVIEAPTYLSTVVGSNLEKAGVVTSVANFAKVVGNLTSALLVDYIIRHEYLTTLNARKVFCVIAFIVPSACFTALCYVDYNLTAANVLIIAAYGSYGCESACLLPNIIDITREHSGIITGIVYTISSSSGFISPLILGELIEKKNNVKQWCILFLVILAVQIFGMTFFLVFAKGELQQWSVNDEERTNLIEMKEKEARLDTNERE